MRLHPVYNVFSLPKDTKGSTSINGVDEYALRELGGQTFYV
ncbi:MAG TPA: hypothetical protein PLH43_12085 [Acetivibrio sp.]|nr:hypothetical protein [Acetivibrio sp.]HOM03545.1 hypothetical protein [Acetivibrio sp.]